MDINVLNECNSLSLAGKITFPEVVMKLAAAGTERYIADLAGLRKLYYGINGEIHIGSLAFDASAINPVFNSTEVKNTIKDIQQQKINYRTFLHRIMEAGCCHYEVFLKGSQAVYFGRDGSQHIELFPKAK